ncbi:MAG TPA: nucleotidyltransferase domain-containing protein [Dictyoglomaceae bacterium]|nr:nucleotidyltransferase domain-containing protein [Dictyoglomaceae bacterium]HOL40064.1 nucleotidyltransferase domain-containing protein [Dictyoglomaceae bacterium]HOP95698.1 nucleotidyltransferase domain-containing protein [Dictyoglomaceae bacterium]HPP16606.1 nucleotidyltransferase domain-containing protein [Dictyoglomaceae bacterium]
MKNIIPKLKDLKIALLYLFGSSVLGTEREDSDVDIGVVFLDDNILKDSLKVYNALYEILSPIFPEKELDIVFLDRAPLTLKFEVVTTGRVIYKISEDYDCNYKEKVVKEYIDFKPLLDEQDQELLKRL